MALSIEQILTDARLLVTRLKDHDGAADNLLTQTQTLYQRMDAMKQVRKRIHKTFQLFQFQIVQIRD